MSDKTPKKPAPRRATSTASVGRPAVKRAVGKPVAIIASGDILRAKAASARTLIGKQATKANAALGDAKDKSYKAVAKANELVQDNPLLATAAAVAAGAALAVLFPRGRALIKAGTAVIAAAGARASEAVGSAGEAISAGAGTAYARAADVAGGVKTAVSDADLPGRAAELTAMASALARDAAHAIGSGAESAKSGLSSGVSKVGATIEDVHLSDKVSEIAGTAVALVKETVDAVGKAAGKLKK